MNSGDFKRKLTAVLSADVKGYSRLMQQDEEATVRTITEYREVMRVLIQAHRGRVVDAKGDNLLADFASVVDAVRCAVEIQKQLRVKNDVLPENRRMEFRIGINLGDVIEEGETIYGDGVNVAARLEGLADGGGICISRMAFDNVKNKVNLGYEYLGEHSVKNIADPVRVYKVLMDPKDAGKVVGEKGSKRTQWRWIPAAVALLVLVAGGLVWNFYWRPPKIEPASKEKMAFPLPDKPSIAVLPFANVSGDPKEEYFGDGLTEQIIAGLSKLPRLFVIARNSTFVYKGKPVKIQKVAEDLGVQYVLEGSVQKSGDRVRITVQLIDAIKGRHVWSEYYDRELKDVFALQDEITIKIMNGMSIKLTEGEQARRWTKAGTTNLKALEKNYQAFGYFMRNTKEDNDTARQLYEEAIALDPEFVWPYVYLGYNYFASARYGWTDSPAKSYQMAFELAQKALAIDESDDRVHTLLSILYLVKREHDKSLAEAERAVALNPNGADAYFGLAAVVGCSGRWDESVPHAEKMIRLGPFPGVSHYFVLGRAYFMTGKYDMSVETWKKVIKISPDFVIAHLFLAACYSSMGRDAEAGAAAKEVLRINPTFNTESHAKTLPYKVRADVEREVAALRKAGLPENPPLPLPDKPSIAVLPFVNMSDDPQQEYFSDGISEDLITDLSKLSGLIVIARTSSFTYKGKTVNVQQIGQDLKVRYLLEGSVRKAGDQLRINAQLVDASNGQHLWAERYDGKMGDIFTLQDGITRKIVSALALKLTASEQKALADKGTDNPLAYEEYLKGWENYRQHTNESFARAKVYLEKAVELDPEFARAYAALAVLYLKAVQTAGLKQGLGLTDERKVGQASLKSRYLLEKAMKKPTALAHGMMSQIYLNMFLHNEAFTEIERAIAMDPNNPELHDWKSNILWFMGKDREAMESAKTAIRLDPNNPAQYFIRLARAYLPDGDLQESLTLLERARTLNPELSGMVAATQSIIYGLQSRDQEARAAYEVYAKSRVVPPRNLEEIMAYYPFSDLKKSDRIAEAFVRAGAPGKPGDYCKVSRDNLFKGPEIKNLLFGHKITGISPTTGEQFWMEWKSDGELNVIRGALRDKGRSWIEGNVMFVQLEKITGGLFWNYTTFRNPGGTKEQKNQYIWVDPARNITCFSPAE